MGSWLMDFAAGDGCPFGGAEVGPFKQAIGVGLALRLVGEAAVPAVVAVMALVGELAATHARGWDRPGVSVF